MIFLADLTTEALRALLAAGPCAVLLPTGSVEPHGPHLPLGTDTLISLAACEEAARRLRERGTQALIAPAVPFGVTDFARGFPGAVSVPAAALTAFLRAVIEGLLREGFAHVCLVNNHLEPAHDQAVRAAVEGLAPRASVACPLTRRWARTLSAEFKSGACHAGQYETSLVLAARPELVDQQAASALPDVAVSLSKGIAQGLDGFLAMGLDRAYTGSPRAASGEEGSRMLSLLADMIVAEVEEARAR